MNLVGNKFVKDVIGFADMPGNVPGNDFDALLVTRCELELPLPLRVSIDIALAFRFLRFVTHGFASSCT
jgi:hypothetical protein